MKPHCALEYSQDGYTHIRILTWMLSVYLGYMADDKLLQSLSRGLESGMTEQQVKERLVKEGWNENDVNGAYALHILSQKPIGSNLITAWKQSQLDTKTSFLTQVIRTLGLVGLLLILAVVIDWYGYTIPLLQKYTIRSYIETRIPSEYLPSARKESQDSTTTPVSVTP